MTDQEFNSLEWCKIEACSLNDIINGYTIEEVETRTDFYTSEGVPVPGAVIIHLIGNGERKVVIIGVSDECDDSNVEELPIILK